MRRRLLSAVILCFLCYGTGIKAQDKQARIENNLVEAIYRFNGNDFTGARTILTAILGQAPEDDAVNYYLGLCDFALGDLEEAETFLARAVELDASNYWYRERLASLYGASGQYQKMIDLYEKMVEDFPKKREPYYALANIYAQTNQPDKLSRTLERISELSGESPQILAMQGDAKMQDYEDSTALDFYNRALDMDGTYPPALLGKAEVMRLRRQYDDYFDNLDKYMFSDMVVPEAKAEYLRTLFQNIDGRFYQNFKEQLDELATGVVSMHPSDSTILTCVGSYYYSTGRYPEAKEHLGRNRSLYPDSYSATVLYAQLLSYSGDWEDLVDECEKAYAAFPYETGFLETKLMAYYNLGDYDSAIKEGERLCGIYPKKSHELASTYASMGDICYQSGNRSGAYGYYEKALKIEPDFVLVLNNYAYYLCLEGKKLSKAYKMSRRAVELEPDNASYLDTIGWILYLQGRSSDAKAYFKRAMIYGGKDSPECLEHYAEVLDSLGESDLGKYYHNLADQKKTE